MGHTAGLLDTCTPLTCFLTEMFTGTVFCDDCVWGPKGARGEGGHSLKGCGCRRGTFAQSSVTASLGQAGRRPGGSSPWRRRTPRGATAAAGPWRPRRHPGRRQRAVLMMTASFSTISSGPKLLPLIKEATDGRSRRGLA